MENQNGGDPALVFTLLKLALFTVLVPGTVTVWLPLFGFYPAIRHQPIEWNAVAAGAVIVIAIGVAGYLWTALDFAIYGKGTPAPIDMPKVLVVRGLYRYTRNPMYISVLAILLGETLLFWSVALLRYAALLTAMFYIWVLIQEEPTLRRKMGPAYEQYCEDVPRWIPRFIPRRRTDAL
ncbi:MAG: isoprenylcysteine carboxylmethyltransferase family protein [Candidatus Acidiferrales bacterium]